MTKKKSFSDELKELESSGLKRTLPSFDSKEIVNLSSNDYLGLSHHDDVVRAAEEAVRKFGTGGTSSRLLAGTQPLHRELEHDLARFLGKQKALVFSSGYHANTGILPALTDSDDIIFVDRLAHASLIDGVRLSRARFRTFDHNDLSDLESLLKSKRTDFRRAFVVTEGLFSMDGDRPPLKEIVELAHRWDAFVYLDEAHSFGAEGPDGKGFAAQESLLDQIDIFVGTLSKTLGSQGGFVAGNGDMIDLLISRCRSFLFTTALAPACAGAARKALELLPSMERRRTELKELSVRVRNRIELLGYNCLSGSSQIVPIMTGELTATQRLSSHLFNAGFFVPSIRPPTVPDGACRIRLSLTHDLVDVNLDPLIQALKGASIVPTY